RGAGVEKRQVERGISGIAEISKDEAGALVGVSKKLVDAFSSFCQRHLSPGKTDHNPGKQKLQTQSPEHGLQANGTAIGGAEVGDRQEHKDAQQACKSRHEVLCGERITDRRLENPVYCSRRVKGIAGIAAIARHRRDRKGKTGRGLARMNADWLQDHFWSILEFAFKLRESFFQLPFHTGFFVGREE